MDLSLGVPFPTCRLFQGLMATMQKLTQEIKRADGMRGSSVY